MPKNVGTIHPVNGTSGEYVLISSDPVWTVEILDDGTITVRLYKGDITLATAAGKELAKLTDNQTITIRPDQTVTSVASFDPQKMSDEEQAAVKVVTS
jgi:hypothetical protein